MKITIIDDYAEREAARKLAKTVGAIKRRDGTLRAKAKLEAEKDAALWQPSSPPHEPPQGDELLLGDIFGIRSHLACGITRFRIDNGRA
jgi:hypothetical protein